ncbi:hypothetical protein [Pseudomonas sp.]|uniref:hypothetical protein n=1 Tax=Pseudomonas sp. TaxID=306 RepID=UPI003FD7FDD8
MIDEIYVITNVVHFDEDQAIYWFGRLDQKDDVRALKIVAYGAEKAWETLSVHHKAIVENDK